MVKGEKFRLRDSISQEAFNFHGLPMNSIRKNGVVFSKPENKEEIILNESRNAVYYKFQYHDEQGKLEYASLERSIFERYFEPEKNNIP